MNKLNPAVLKQLRDTYTPGTRVELDQMDDPYNSKLTTGSRGTVVAVDDIGTIHVKWDCGSSLGVCYGEDMCHVVTDEKLKEGQMKIRIYQVDPKKDACFRDMEFLKSRLHRMPSPKDYTLAYEGIVEAKSLESLYAIFNIAHPRDYKARSMSVSDVVEVVESGHVPKGFYFCDTIGFKEIAFDRTKVGPKKEKKREQTR